MALIRDSDQNFLREEFGKNLTETVEMIVFTSSNDSCQYCSETVQLAEEVASLSDKIRLTVLDFAKDRGKADELGIDKYPSLVIFKDGDRNGRIRYSGIPSGYEFGSLIEDIKMVSRNDAKISAKAMEIISKIDSPVRIKVYVTPTCPYCPRAVGTAHKFALSNKNIVGEMVESSEFHAEAVEQGVTAVPHIVINGEIKFDGALPDVEFAEYVLEASGSNRTG
ncbi:MAG: thioredoxin family protein [Candidatus Thermoplasmatota archaeon]|jgi:glutaredoxin-like protein|nr:thioredoxin family protein [Candidatus Thermoplasmatota archaeon]MCL5785399.1 thioredoxin family protein [Candidatus Thermoplasmatota archaeon]